MSLIRVRVSGSNKRDFSRSKTMRFLRSPNFQRYLVLTIVLIVFLGSWRFYSISSLDQRDWDPEIDEENITQEKPNMPQVNPAVSFETLMLEVDPHILLKPQWAVTRSWGLRPTNIFQASPSPGQDREEEISWANFFHGTTNGLILELGALDGLTYSISNFFERKAGWKVILIEGSPAALKIPKNRPNALSLQLVVCKEKSTVHLLSAGAVGGILEFMDATFLKRFHSGLLKNGSQGQGSLSVIDMVDWDKVRKSPNVQEQTCLPLQLVFDRFQIQRLNFMVLDLEGGELAALQSLDFDRIRIDVMCVETNRFGNPEDPYIDQVVNFMIGKKYKVFQRTSGRNSWFLAPEL